MRIRRVSLPGQMTRRLDGQVRNNAGGYAYLIDPKQQLDRFLILGTEGGTYYGRAAPDAGERGERD